MLKSNNKNKNQYRAALITTNLRIQSKKEIAWLEKAPTIKRN